MKLLFTNGVVTEGKSQVVGIHHLPETLTEEEKAGGILVESVPEAEKIDGKRAELYIDLTTKELSYVYKDRELTPLEQANQRIADLELAIASLIGGGV